MPGEKLTFPHWSTDILLETRMIVMKKVQSLSGLIAFFYISKKKNGVFKQYILGRSVLISIQIR